MESGSALKRKPFPSHPWRLPANGDRGKSKKLKKQVSEKLIHVWLLDFPNEDDACTSREEYSFSEEMVFVKGYVSLSSDMDSTDIETEILDLINTKYPEVKDFDYVKRERQTIFIPAVPPGWDWGFNNVKALLGQGKLYCRLSSSCRKILGLKKGKKNTLDKFLASESIESLSSDDSNELPAIKKSLPSVTFTKFYVKIFADCNLCQNFKLL
jgi:hypothetical protein